MKKLIFLVSFLLFIFISTKSIYADYVLPYPSTMPGGISYKIHLIWEGILKYWYFGDFASFEYNLKESDKYLVESKTLFEYNQYLLGFKALEKSNTYFSKTLPFLESAKKHGKNIVDKRNVLTEAAKKHIEVLQKIDKETPVEFNWSPEKIASSILKIHDLINNSIVIREKYL